MKKRVKLIVRLVLLIGTPISLYFVPWILVKAWIMPLPDTVQGQVDEALEYGFEGMIVYVDQGGKEPEFYAGGWKDRDNKIPADPNSLFKIASISKLYTAVAITKLVHDEVLFLDKTLTDYFPELAERIEYSDQITLRMMVQHRSGIPNFTDNPEFWSNPPENSDGALEFALDLPAYFKPDSDYGYSNTNYLLLRKLMDEVLGYDHFLYVRKEILAPLELKNTFSSVNKVDIDDMMSGYYVGIEDDFKHEDQGMVASAEDVGKFLRALNKGTVFEEGEQEIYSSIYVYEHGGLVPGYQSMATYHKDIDAVVVQFMNTTDFEGYEWNLLQITHNRIVKILTNN